MTGKKTKVASVGEEFTLSRAEAERRLKIEGYPSLEQIIQRTKAKADWPDERWDEIQRIAAAAEKPDALVVNRKTVFAHIRHCNRWVAAASSLIFVLAVLLIFIPESRAFAIQVYHSVVRLFDNRMEIQQPIQTHTSCEYDSQIADNFASELEEEHPQKQEMQMLSFADIQKRIMCKLIDRYSNHWVHLRQTNQTLCIKVSDVKLGICHIGTSMDENTIFYVPSWYAFYTETYFIGGEIVSVLNDYLVICAVDGTQLEPRMPTQ